MEIILRRDVEKLGKQGEVVVVANGYGRNYLIPNGFAWIASSRAKSALEEEKRTQDRKSVKDRAGATELAERIEGASCTISMRAGDDDKLFGAVTSQHIASALAESGIEIDRRKIELAEPIKELGVFRVPVRLHPEVTAAVKVWIVRE